MKKNNVEIIKSYKMPKSLYNEVLGDEILQSDQLDLDEFKGQSFNSLEDLGALLNNTDFEINVENFEGGFDPNNPEMKELFKSAGASTNFHNEVIEPEAIQPIEQVEEYIDIDEKDLIKFNQHCSDEQFTRLEQTLTEESVIVFENENRKEEFKLKEVPKGVRPEAKHILRDDYLEIAQNMRVLQAKDPTFSREDMSIRYVQQTDEFKIMVHTDAGNVQMSHNTMYARLELCRELEFSHDEPDLPPNASHMENDGQSIDTNHPVLDEPTLEDARELPANIENNEIEDEEVLENY